MVNGLSDVIKLFDVSATRPRTCANLSVRLFAVGSVGANFFNWIRELMLMVFSLSFLYTAYVVSMKMNCLCSLIGGIKSKSVVSVCRAILSFHVFVGGS